MKRVFIRVLSGTDDADNENLPSSLDSTGSSGRFSSEQNILINTVLATSPNALDISWDINDGIPATSLTLHYRIVGSNEFQTANAMIDAKEFTINNLRAHTEYEVFASVPLGLGGSISNIRKGKMKNGKRKNIMEIENIFFNLICAGLTLVFCFFFHLLLYQKAKHWMVHQAHLQ